MIEHIRFTVNRRAVALEIDGTTPLLAVLRDQLGLKAARFGCGLEQCGCCVVLVDGEPVYSCARPVASLTGSEVTTLEACRDGDRLDRLRDAFLAEQAGQCGYCLSGVLMSAFALLERNPDPTRADVIAALDRHLCRCGAHNRIIRAVRRAAAMRRSETVS